MPRATFELPDPVVVVLAGPAGSGKSRFAARHFAAADVLSSDDFRGLVAGDPGDQSATSAAFGLLGHALDERMKRRRLTVIDATSVTRRERRRFLGVARKHHVPAVVIAFALPLDVCQRRAVNRRARPVSPEVVARQREVFVRHLAGIEAEGFDDVLVLTSVEEVDEVVIVRVTAAS